MVAHPGHRVGRDLSMAQRLLRVPHLAASHRTTASDLLPLAGALRRALRVDRLWICSRLPAGPVLIEATRDGAAERGHRTGGFPLPDGPCTCPASQYGGPGRRGCPGIASVSRDGPVRISARALPEGWRAGVRVPLRSPDGRHAGCLLLGWTRWSGRLAAIRATRGAPAMALIGRSRSLGAFWANAWAVHERERECSRLAAVIDHSDVPIVALDPQGRVAIWNTAMAALTGHTAGRAVGRPVGDLFTLTREDGRAVPLTDGPQGSARLTTATGRELWVEVSSSRPADPPAGRSADGPARTLTAVFVDRSANRQLADTRHLILAAIHHELQGPLTMIQGHAQLLEETLTEQRLGLSAGAITDAAEIMNRIIGDLMRLDADPLDTSTASVRAVEVAPLLRRTVAAVPAAAGRTVISCAGLTVRADPVRLRECLLLIISNAEKYAPHGRITITARRHAAHAAIDIADQGPGIPGSQRHRVLQPYYRLPGTRDLPGSGLGLHIARLMMKSMHGDLRLGDAPTGGLKVTLRLPLAEEPPVQAGAHHRHDGPGEQPAGQPGERVRR